MRLRIIIFLAYFLLLSIKLDASPRAEACCYSETPDTKLHTTQQENLEGTTKISDIYQLLELLPSSAPIEVKDALQGGTFIYVTEKLSIDGGTVFPCISGGYWKRVFDTKKGARPEWYGAKGDGQSDDAAAIITCKKNNSIVLFTEGATYRSEKMTRLISDNIYIGNGATLKNFRFEIRAGNSVELYDITLDNTNTIEAFSLGTLPQQGKDLKMGKRAILKNCRFISGLENYKANRIYCEQFVIQDCVFDGIKNIEIWGANDGKIDGCLFKNQNSDDNVVIKGINKQNPPFKRITSVKNLEISNNIIENGISVLSIGTNIYDSQTHSIKIHHNKAHNVAYLVLIKPFGQNGDHSRNYQSSYYLDGVVKNIEIYENSIEQVPVYIDSLNEVHERHCLTREIYPSARSKPAFIGFIGFQLAAGQIVSNIDIHNNEVKAAQAKKTAGYNYVGSMCSYQIDYKATSTILSGRMRFSSKEQLYNGWFGANSFVKTLDKKIQKRSYKAVLASLKDSNQTGGYWMVERIGKKRGDSIQIWLRKIHRDSLALVYKYSSNDFKGYIEIGNEAKPVKGDRFVLGYVPKVINFKVRNMNFKDLSIPSSKQKQGRLGKALIRQNQYMVSGGSSYFKDKNLWDWDDINYDGAENKNHGMASLTSFSPEVAAGKPHLIKLRSSRIININDIGSNLIVSGHQSLSVPYHFNAMVIGQYVHLSFKGNSSIHFKAAKGVRLNGIEQGELTLRPMDGHCFRLIKRAPNEYVIY